MAQIKIVIKSGATFDPNPAEATTQDNVFWHNNDDKPHKPTPLDANGKMVQGVWLNYEVPPGSSSAGVAFFNPDETIVGSPTNPLPAPYTINYVCAVQGHQNEKGTIIVTG